MANASTGKPVLRHIASLGSLRDTPTEKKPWPLERKIAAVREAGFDGFTDRVTPRHHKLAGQHGLMMVGGFASSAPDEFRPLLQQGKDAGARHINVRLGAHDTSASDAVRLALRLMHEARALGVEAAVKVRRDTCTETPEKVHALADGYQRITGELLPLAWDFSHIAVLKRLTPPYHERLLARPDLIQRADQFHFRPFNGHHCQVPVTQGRGRLSVEFEDWLPFARQCLKLWLQGQQAGREIFVVPAMGPASSGHHLRQFTDSWSDAVKLRGVLDQIWKSLPGTAVGKARVKP
jgi:hypothetical protein